MLKKRQGWQQAANLVQVCNMIAEATAAPPLQQFYSCLHRAVD